MNEQLLHYIWKTQSFVSINLRTTEGLPLSVYYPGSHNYDSGPDFSEARIKIDDFEWAGQIEIHIRSSDWYQHSHDGDPAYDNVILHVVWDHDREVFLPNNEILPVFEMKRYVDPEILENYRQITCHPGSNIPCRELINEKVQFAQMQIIEKAVVERLQAKAEETLRYFRQCDQDWEETVYRLLGRSFGLKVNKESFLRLTEILPLKLLRTHRNQEVQVNALLFGQAGFLDDEKDEYQGKLKKEFNFLRKKYGLHPLSRHHWKFSKLRPYSFPTLRISQFSEFIRDQSSLFSFFLEIDSLVQLKKELNKNTRDYWKKHTDFGKASSKNFSIAGSGFTNTIILNVIVPVLAASSKYYDDVAFMDRAINWLERLPFESNSITKRYKNLNFKSESALDSQGQIHLYREYCLKKRCLSCNIGVKLMS